jgi:hypothetical protein
MFLEEVTFEEGCELKEIANGAFGECIVKSVRIPRRVEILDARCFGRCRSLCDLTFEEGSELEQIDPLAFEGCPIDPSVVPQIQQGVA